MLRKCTDEDISDEECEKVINPASDIFNLYDEDFEKIKAEVIRLLRIKYSLEIISEDPSDLKK